MAGSDWWKIEGHCLGQAPSAPPLLQLLLELLLPLLHSEALRLLGLGLGLGGLRRHLGRGRGLGGWLQVWEARAVPEPWRLGLLQGRLHFCRSCRRGKDERGWGECWWWVGRRFQPRGQAGRGSSWGRAWRWTCGRRETFAGQGRLAQHRWRWTRRLQHFCMEGVGCGWYWAIGGHWPPRGSCRSTPSSCNNPRSVVKSLRLNLPRQRWGSKGRSTISDVAI